MKTQTPTQKPIPIVSYAESLEWAKKEEWKRKKCKECEKHD